MMDRQATLHLAHCERCGGWTFPAGAYGCRQCGADSSALQARAMPASPRLLNFVTVHAELAPGLPVPCVVGEVELAPGVVEEALIDVPSEDGLWLGAELRPRPVQEGDSVTWRFVPVGDRA